MSVFTEEPANITHTIVVMKYYWLLCFAIVSTSEICVRDRWVCNFLVLFCLFACVSLIVFFSNSKKGSV